jgi:hypothetical protein
MTAGKRSIAGNELAIFNDNEKFPSQFPRKLIMRIQHAHKVLGAQITHKW